MKERVYQNNKGKSMDYIWTIIIISGGVFLFKKDGWIFLWNTFFVFILLFVLVLAQKHIGKIEGLLIAVVPFVAGQMLIKYNKKIQIFYFSKQTKFINWCNKNIYQLKKG